MRNTADQYGYIYMDHAPYEILGNDVLPFSDLVKIKRVEDVLEKYWNAHRMDHTIHYLIEHEFETAFDFFQSFGDYWERQGWQKIGHQLEDLFKRLQGFLQESNITNPDVVEGLMKLDYFLAHKFKPRKIWWEFTLDKNAQSDYMKKLAAHPEVVSGSFNALKLNERELHKHAVIEVIPFDLARYVQEARIDRHEQTLLIIHFQPDSQTWATYYTVKLSAFLQHQDM